MRHRYAPRLRNCGTEVSPEPKKRSGNSLFARAWLGLALLTAWPANAQDPAAADLIRRVDSFLSASDAIENKSARCRAYDGKVAVPVPFNALAQRLRSGGRPAEPAVLLVPARRDYIDVDGKNVVTVEAGAVATGRFSSDGMADVRAQILVATHKGLPDLSHSVVVGLPSSERSTGSYAARNVLGQPIRVTQADRTTRGLALLTERLFPQAKDDDAPLTFFQARGAAAARAVRLALVVEPEAPFLIEGGSEGEAPTARVPVQYAERATVIVAAPRCLLALDPNNHVLASADAGSN